MSLTRFTPGGEFLSLRDAVDRLFQDSFIRPSGLSGLAAGHLAVPVDLWETKGAYHLRADLPGLTAEDIQIDATGDGVTIAGELKSEEPAEGALRLERRSGRFSRTFGLPLQIDASRVEASFTNGVLALILPKAESVKPKSVKIQAK
ncbi:MAG: Hsp20/alpha crystallin family protein [Chloroflexi bacterium]|nr:Hsp20/alpha crystallin family protein [Chloroflexota bacterium]